MAGNDELVVDSSVVDLLPQRAIQSPRMAMQVRLKNNFFGFIEWTLFSRCNLNNFLISLQEGKWAIQGRHVTSRHGTRRQIVDARRAREHQ